MSSVEEFYDEYTEKQLRKGIHHRHLSIQRWLEKFGLKRNHKILEIGSGIGTVSELMLRYLNAKGSLTVTDISPKSLNIARQRLSKYFNVKICEFDFSKDRMDDQFDVIVLPDVLEHIPLDRHDDLFDHLHSMLKDSGWVFIHIPEPNYLEWIIRNKPELLQIIDQPIHTYLLAESIKKSGLYIQYLQSYSLFCEGPDYQVIVLKKNPSPELYERSIQPPQDSVFRRLKRKFRFVIRGKK